MMDYIRSFLTLIFAISLMYVLLDCKVKSRRQYYFFGLYAAFVLAANVLFLRHFGYAAFLRWYPLLVHSTVLLAFILISGFKPIKVIFVHLTAVAISSSFVLIGLFVSRLLNSDWATVNTVCYILYLPTWFILCRYLRPAMLYMLRNTDQGWYAFCAIPLTFSAFCYVNGRYNVDQAKFGQIFENALLFFILTLSAYVLIFRHFRQTREQLTMQNEQNLLRTQVAAAETHLEALQESQAKTIIYRHDMRHHLNLINAYLTDDNQAAAQEYISQIESAVQSAVIERYCGNYTVNLILYSYLSKAKSQQIAVTTQINLLEESAVADMDLCVIFANAIENAINACSRIADANGRSLRVICKAKSNKLLIQVTNSYVGTVRFVNDMPVSNLPDHGLGTQSIAAVAQKYGGVCSFTAEDGVFRTSIIL